MSNSTQNTTTISGLNINTSKDIVRIISALIGIFVFYCVPLIANTFKRPLTSVLINIIPNALILGYFILEDEFELYLKSSIFVPIFTTFDNILSYLLLIFYNWSGSKSLTINIVIWAIVVVASYFFKQ
jgi:uncharacterized membrane protein YoaK (UPF0700 family)